MKLAEFPPVIFVLIVPFLRISDICCLYLTGSKRLIYAMSDSKETKELSFRLDRDVGVTKIPNFARLFPGLKKISISHPSLHSIVQTSKTPLTHLPSTLEEIEFHFFSARDWFFHLPQNALHQGPVQLYSKQVPASKLTVDNTPWRSKLFPRLRTLKVSGGSNCGCLSDLAFAPNLESLELHDTNGINEEHAMAFPSSLTELKIPHNSSITPAHYKFLPPSLRTIETSVVSHRSIDRPNQLKAAFEHAPPLTSLSFNFNPGADVKILTMFPSSLTKLRCAGSATLTKDIVESLPRGLISLDSKFFIPPECISYLPHLLEELGLGSITTDRDISDSDLSIALPASTALPTIFPHLKSLTISVPKPNSPVRTAKILAALRYPKLEHLSVLSPLIGDVCNLLSSLPPTMKELHLKLDPVSFDAELAAIEVSEHEGALDFPENLQALSLRFLIPNVNTSYRSGTSRAFVNSALYVEQGKIRSLPSGLKHFSLLGMVSNYGELLQLLPHGLVNLSLESHQSNDDISWMMDLPPRLLRLSFEGFRGPINREHLQDLPSSLRELNLRGVSGITTTEVKYLPPNLTHLTMPEVLLNPPDLALLPPSLTYYDAPPSVSSEWRKMLDARVAKRLS